MLDIEGRLKVVDERMADHSQLFMDVRQSLLQFQAAVDRRFEQVEVRLTGLDQKFDTRLTSLEQRFESRLTALDQKMDSGFAALDLKVDRGFRWTSGIMLTGLVAIVAAVLSK